MWYIVTKMPTRIVLGLQAWFLWSWRSCSREGRIQLWTGIIAHFLTSWRAPGKALTSPSLALLICDVAMMPVNEDCLVKWSDTFRELNNDSGTWQVFNIVSYFRKALIAFIYLHLFLAVLGLCCCAQVSLAAASGGSSPVAVCGLLPAEASRCRAQPQ